MKLEVCLECCEFFLIGKEAYFNIFCHELEELFFRSFLWDGYCYFGFSKMFEIMMKTGADCCGEDEFFREGVVSVVLDEEFFEEAIMFFKGVFLFVG